VISDKLNDWLKILGMFGVVGSLVFVGIQLKQAQDIAVASTYADRAAITVEFNSGVIGTPQWFSANAKIYSGLRDQLTAEEWIALETQTGTLLSIMENNHYQYETGFLTETQWSQVVDELKCALSEPAIRNFAQGFHTRHSFKAVLEELIEQAKGSSRSCWVSYSDDPWPYFNAVEVP
jgi:hypothetical protein